MTAICSTCYEEKPLSAFDKNQTQCKDCLRNYLYRKKYGISLKQYEKMAKAQDNKCAICGKQEKNKKLAVDHCHTTGKVRKLLCSTCNTGLGMVKEDINILSSMISYLMEHKF